ncbi:cytochrome C nitrite reductase, partial [Escherichia coli]|nr:cytochrome C nitrite reductase [Escherichia coli]
MSVLRSLLTAGVLATGLLWATAASATPQMAQENVEGRWVVTQQRSADSACLDCHKPDQEGMHGTHAEV